MKTTDADEETGLLSFFSSVLKKSAEIPHEIKSLPKSVEIIAEEVTKLSQSVLKVTKMVMEHHEAIEQIFAAQAIILANIMKNKVESLPPSTNKNKFEKPN